MRTQRSQEQIVLTHLRSAAQFQDAWNWCRKNSIAMAAGALAKVCELSGETVGEAIERLKIDAKIAHELLNVPSGAGDKLRSFSRRAT